MRILYLSQYFPPEVNAPAQRLLDFAKAWREAGHEVIVLTGFPNHPAGVVYDGYKLKPFQRETIDGVPVIRTYLYPAPNKGFLRRSLNYSSFMASAVLFGSPMIGKVDIVIASSPQLLVGVAGWFISAIKRAPFVLEIRDVWPEALLAVNANVSRRVYSILNRIADFLYKRADKIITVTTGAQEEIKKHGVDPGKLALIPSGIRTDVVKPMPPPPEIRNALGNGNNVIVSYIGTHGMAQKLSTVLEAAERLSDKPGIQFILIGDGAEKDDLLKMKQELGLGNVHFIDQVPQGEALRYIAASDICLVPLRKADLFTLTIPSKVYEIMACGRPMVLGVDGEARELVETTDAGVFVEPEDPKALAEAVVKLANDPDLRSTYGQNGRRFVVENCDKTSLSRQYLELLTTIESKRAM